MISPARNASSNTATSAGSMRLGKLESTITMTSALGYSSKKERTASSSWLRLGRVRPSVATFEPSTTTLYAVMECELSCQMGDLAHPGPTAATEDSPRSLSMKFVRTLESRRNTWRRSDLTDAVKHGHRQNRCIP